jgi:hypothetical protein
LDNVARDYYSQFLWGCNETYIYTNNRTTCIHNSKFKLTVRLKVEEGCSYHLVSVSVLQYCQFSHCKIKSHYFVNTHRIFAGSACMACSSALDMEVIRSSETSVNYRTMRQHIPEVSTLNNIAIKKTPWP